MLAPYRKAFATPGALSFSAAGLVGRLPISTLALGIVLLAEWGTGSYALAGAVSGVCVFAEAVCAPLLGRVIDRVGQHRAMPWAVLVFTVGMVGLISAVQGGWPTAWLFVFAAVTGGSYPPVGACVRARWTHALEPGPALNTAFSVEAVNDEIVFITGPVLVTVLATQVHEFAGLLAVLVLSVAGVLWLSSQRRTEPPARRHGGPAAPLPIAPLAMIVLVAAGLGAVFGAAEVATVAFSDEHDSPALTGLLLATWALGSMLAGLVTGAITWKATALRRLRLGSVALAVAIIPLPFIEDPPVMFAALFIAGFAVSPTLIAAVALVEETVPATRLTEGITWLTTGIALGVSAGAVLSGHLIEARGASTAFLVPVAAGAVGVVAAWLTRPAPTRAPAQAASGPG